MSHGVNFRQGKDINMQKLKDFVVEEDGIFHKSLEYSIETDDDTYNVYLGEEFVEWYYKLEQAIEYVLKQVEESSK